MKQNIILALIFFVIFFGLKMIFDNNELSIKILHSVVATLAFLVFRMIFRKKKNPENPES